MVGEDKYCIGKITEEGEFKPTPFYHDVEAKDPTILSECKNCKFLPICMGGCAAESVRKNGHPNGSGCDISKYIWKEGLKFYLACYHPRIFKETELIEILGKTPDKS